MSRYDEYAAALKGRRLPAAYVDLDLLDQNVTALRGRARGNPIRVASKSVRCVSILRRVLDQQGYAGLMAFTAAEAAHLASHGFDDILVAYPTLEPTELARVFESILDGSHIVLMVDDPEQVRVIGELADEAGVVVPLCLDVDMSFVLPGLHFGVRRSPVRTVADALRVAVAIRRRHSLRLEGVMGYEAQIAGLPDDTERRTFSRVVRLLKRRSLRDVRKRRGAIVDALRGAGHTLRFVNGGGTGSLESTAADRSVTESTAGSGLYSPTLFDEFQHFRHEPAAGFALPIVRRPTADIVTCHGGGYIASGSAGKDKLPRPYLPEGLELLDQEGAGEVQTPLRVPAGMRLSMGDPVFFRHAKAGELCERFDALLLIRDGEVVDEVKTYRGEGKCFL